MYETALSAIILPIGNHIVLFSVTHFYLMMIGLMLDPQAGQLAFAYLVSNVQGRLFVCFQ